MAFVPKTPPFFPAAFSFTVHFVGITGVYKIIFQEVIGIGAKLGVTTIKEAG